MPTIVSAVGGVVTVATCPGCLVEVLRAEPTSSSRYGQGSEFVGSAVAAAADTVAVGTSLPVGAEVSATATAPDGSTSEFSYQVTMISEAVRPTLTLTFTLTFILVERRARPVGAARAQGARPGAAVQHRPVLTGRAQ